MRSARGLRQADRIEHVQSPVIPIVGRWTSEHPGTISLGQGVVHYPPPPEVLRTVSQAALADRTIDRYGPFGGRDSLLRLLEEKLARDNGIDVASSDCSVICTAGANMAFLNAILAIADIGDEVILLSPYYFNHHMAIEIAGCRFWVKPEGGLLIGDIEVARVRVCPIASQSTSPSPAAPTIPALRARSPRG